MADHHHVYIASAENCWIPARLLSENGATATVSVPVFETEEELLECSKVKKFQKQQIDLSFYPNKVLPLQNVDQKGGLDIRDDMNHLPYVHEPAILYNLKARHLLGKPYTRTGDICIACNPYQWFTDIYTVEMRRKYSKVLVYNERKRAPLEPHVYETSSLTYSGLLWGQENQSILVSGESGAGKTETVKICLNHIACIQEAEKEESPIVRKVLDTNPLLEAFGNAQTRRNDNSSRFGKYLQLQFHRHGDEMGEPRCDLVGSKCEVYLLEKSRVVVHEEEERNFHIFHQLLAAKNSVKTQFWDGLHHTNNESFAYVGWTATDTIEGVKDAKAFDITLEYLALIGITGEKLKTMMQCMCVVLQLGNIVFEPDRKDEDRSEIMSTGELKSLCKLIGIPEKDMKLALLERTVVVRGEKTKVPLNSKTAADSCDALAKEIYKVLFLWLVEVINSATCAEQNFEGGESENYGLIGMLDIFGFESFDDNGFEQLCINYANEKLQHKFTSDIFKAVLEEYRSEGIDVDDIEYDDNTLILNLIEGKRGLLDMLNEECVRPRGNDASFVYKATFENKDSNGLVIDKTFDQYTFGIHHYAGTVVYNAMDFVAKNKDTLPTDMEQCISAASNDIIKKEFTKRAAEVEEDSGPRRGNIPGRGAGLKRKKSNIVAPTVWTKYKSQLTDLMAKIEKTKSRYIRCIKPNDLKQPLIMQHVPTIEQLRSAGVIAAVTISNSAFPNRLPNNVALHRFKPLWSQGKTPLSRNAPDSEVKENIEKMLTELLAERSKKAGKKMFAVGHTKTYFRSGALEYLESERPKIVNEKAIEIQRCLRGFLVRRGTISYKRAEREADALLKREEELEEQRDALKGKIRAIEKNGKALVDKAEQEAYEAEKKGNDKKLKQMEADLKEQLGQITQGKKDNKKKSKAMKEAQAKYEELLEQRNKMKGGSADVDELNEKIKEKQEMYDSLVDFRTNFKEKVAGKRSDIKQKQQDFQKENAHRVEVQKVLFEMRKLVHEVCDDDDLVDKVDAIATAK